MHPVVEQLGGLGAVGCPEDGPQVLLELPGPDQPRAGPLLERLEPRPLAVGEVLGVLHERVAAALDGGRLLLERPDLLGRQLAFGRPAALALGPGPGGPGGGPGGVPLLAAHGVERVVHPLDHVEGVHDPPRVGAAALDQLPYPPRAVGGHHLYGAPLLARELVEEQVEHVLAGALVRPDEAAAVVVDDHRDVLVALLVRRLVDADAAHAVELSNRPLQSMRYCEWEPLVANVRYWHGEPSIFRKGAACCYLRLAMSESRRRRFSAWRIESGPRTS